MRGRATLPGERGEARRRRREVERRLAEMGLAETWDTRGPRRLSAAPSPDDAEEVARRLAAVLPDLGPVLGSFGRYLALRADLFAPAERRWFQHVVAIVPAADAAVVRSAVAAALGAEIDDLFASFSDEPRRVGLTVQVHPAVTARVSARLAMQSPIGSFSDPNMVPSRYRRARIAATRTALPWGTHLGTVLRPN